MSLSKEAKDNKPKKPVNTYYVFRKEKLIAYKDDNDKLEKIKAEWDALDTSKKEDYK
jgi:ferredoxin-NADP reductase